jgi:tetratricopeptide (TPR) repeat protein
MDKPQISFLVSNAACGGQLANPSLAQELCERAKAALSAYPYKGAVALFKQALAADPNCLDALEGIGYLLLQLVKIEHAMSFFERAISIDPMRATTLGYLSHAHLVNGDVTNAVIYGRKAIEIEPKSSSLQCALGNALFASGAIEDGLCHHQSALDIDPEDANSRLMQAFGRLMFGDYAEGWVIYESRLVFLEGPGRKFPMPRWQGERSPEGAILIYAEQGLGDTLQFVRFLPLVAERVGKIYLEVQPHLLQLLEYTLDVEKVSGGRIEDPSIQFHCPLMSLPFVMGITLSDLPAKTPYLSLDRITATKFVLPQNNQNDLRVGLVWAGNKQLILDRLRSIPPAALLPLGKVMGVTFYSMQYGVTADELRDIFPWLDIVHLSVKIEDTTLAAALLEMDLVVTVDTSAAHLAGALGKPVWILLGLVPDWRWLLEIDSSPWYPTATLFRQRHPGNWADPVEDLAKKLQEEAVAHLSRQSMLASPRLP